MKKTIFNLGKALSAKEQKLVRDDPTYFKHFIRYFSFNLIYLEITLTFK